MSMLIRLSENTVQLLRIQVKEECLRCNPSFRKARMSDDFLAERAFLYYIGRLQEPEV